MAKVVRPEVLKGPRLVEKVERLANKGAKGQQTEVTWGFVLAAESGGPDVEIRLGDATEAFSCRAVLGNISSTATSPHKT